MSAVRARRVATEVPQAPGPVALALVALAGLVAVGVSVTLALTSDHLTRPGLQAFLINWITVPYLVSGTVAWARRPASRLGPLMILTGLTTALVTLQWSNTAWVVWIGHLVDLVPAALFLHVYLAYPSGRLRSRFEQAVVVVGYGLTLGLQVVAIAVDAGPGDPFTELQVMSIAVLLLVGAATLVVRRRGPARPTRRLVGLTVDAFGLSLVLLAALYVAAVNAWPSVELLRNVTFAALGLAPVAFLLGLLDARLARATVADLVVQLRQQPATDLEASLARALHDPSLSIAYWVPQLGVWADQAGEPLDLDETGESRATRVIRHGGEPVAALVFDPALLEEPELLDAVVAAASMALENGRLQADLRAHLKELRESRVRVLEAGRQERQRLERDLHDGAQQRLVALTLELALLDEHSTPGDTRAVLERARNQIAESLEELRDVSRGIYPAVLSGHGLGVALESLAARAPVPLELSLDLDQRLPEPVEVAAYFVVCEGVANIGKHARATSASISVARTVDTVEIDIADDGVGGADRRRGSGLRGLSDRVEALDGRLEVTSPPAGGTHLHASIPCPSPAVV